MNASLRCAAATLALLLTPAACAQSGQAQTQAQGPTLQVDPDRLTMINLMTPKEGVTHAELAALLERGLNEDVSRMPGFISATVHQSRDDSYVVVYAQWEDQASVDVAVERIMGGDAPAMLEAFSNASPEFHPYDVRAVIAR